MGINTTFNNLATSATHQAMMAGSQAKNFAYENKGTIAFVTASTVTAIVAPAVFYPGMIAGFKAQKKVQEINNESQKTTTETKEKTPYITKLDVACAVSGATAAVAFTIIAPPSILFAVLPAMGGVALGRVLAKMDT